MSHLSRLVNPADHLSNKKAWSIIAFLGLIVYANSLYNGFVWDDYGLILENPHVHSFGVFKFFGNDFFLNQSWYRPMFGIYISFLYMLFGQQAFFYHLFQMLIHIANACMVFLLFKKSLKASTALILSLIFLVHPINVETVSFISDSLNVLFLFFGLLALLISQQEKQTHKTLWAIGILLFLSLITRETGVLFIPIILLSQYLFRRQHVAPIFIATLSPLAVYFFIRFSNNVFFHTNEVIPIMRLTLIERLENIPQIIFYYLKTFLYPSQLVVNQHWTIPSVDLIHFYFPLTVVLILSTLIFYLGKKLQAMEKKKFSVFLFFVSWFVIGMALHLQIFPLDMTVADRWFYLPLIGLLGIVGLAIEQIHFNKKAKLLLFVAGIVIIEALGIRTIARNADWKDDITLFSRDSAIMTNYDIENSLGSALIRKGRLDEAKKHLEESVRLAPYRWTNWKNLGIVYEEKGDYKKAQAMYQKAIKNNPNDVAGYVAYAHLLAFHGSPDSAEVVIGDMLKRFPNESQLWTFYALAEYKKGNTEEALAAAQRSYSIRPDKYNSYIYFRLINNLPVEID